MRRGGSSRFPVLESKIKKLPFGLGGDNVKVSLTKRKTEARHAHTFPTNPRSVGTEIEGEGIGGWGEAGWEQSMPSTRKQNQKVTF